MTEEDQGPEVAILLTETPDGLNVSIHPRDAEPNQKSAAVIFAGFLQANMESLIRDARTAKARYESEQESSIATELSVKSIQTSDGNLARQDAKLILPAGYPPLNTRESTQ